MHRHLRGRRGQVEPGIDLDEVHRDEAARERELLAYLEDLQQNNPAEYELLVKDLQEKAAAEGKGPAAAQNQGEQVTPLPGFVAKTRSATHKGRKVFINVCQSDHVDKPAPVEGADDSEEVQMRIPMSLGPPREDLDKSGEGDLSKKEVKQALQSFAKKDRTGKYPKIGELRALFDSFDLDGDGYVTYEELCEYIDERVDGKGRGAEKADPRAAFAKALKKHFDDLDKSGDGDLSKREVKHALQTFSKKDKTGKYPKLKELAAIFADMDLNNDDHVSYEEICDYIDERVGGGDVAAVDRPHRLVEDHLEELALEVEADLDVPLRPHLVPPREEREELQPRHRVDQRRALHAHGLLERPLGVVWASAITRTLRPRHGDALGRVKGETAKLDAAHAA